MDIPLFGLALLTFAVLYLGLNVFLFWTLVITLLVIMMYLAVRWRAVHENYPHGLGDTVQLIILISITWVLFVFLGPKDYNNSIPFLGQGLTYDTPNWSVVITIGVFFMFLVLIIFAVLLPYLQGRISMGGGGGGDDSGKGKVGVGA